MGLDCGQEACNACKSNFDYCNFTVCGLPPEHSHRPCGPLSSCKGAHRRTQQNQKHSESKVRRPQRNQSKKKVEGVPCSQIHAEHLSVGSGLWATELLGLPGALAVPVQRQRPSACIFCGWRWAMAFHQWCSKLSHVATMCSTSAHIVFGTLRYTTLVRPISITNISRVNRCSMHSKGGTPLQTAGLLQMYYLLLPKAPLEQTLVLHPCSQVSLAGAKVKCCEYYDCSCLCWVTFAMTASREHVTRASVQSKCKPKEAPIPGQCERRGRGMRGQLHFAVL